MSKISNSSSYISYKTAFDVTGLAAFKGRYKYEACGWACGVRKFVIEGTPEEWFSITKTCIELSEIKELSPLKVWLETCAKILTFIGSFDETNEDSVQFLRGIVTYENFSCSPDMVSGWIAQLFPYYDNKLRSDEELSNPHGPGKEKEVNALSHEFSTVKIVYKDEISKESCDLNVVSGLDVLETIDTEVNMLKPVVQYGILI